jgi:hypothetical protein
VVQAFAPYRSHKSFGIGVLPRRPWCCRHLVDTHRLDPLAEVLSIDSIPISDQIARSRVPGESLNDLLGGPLRAGVGRDIEVDVAPPMMCQNDKDRQHSKAKRRDGEEVDRH